MFSNWFRNPFRAQSNEDGSYRPSSFALAVATSKKTDYVKQEYALKYEGNKAILVVCTDESLMKMENDVLFSTGNHPVEMFVPMLHFRDAGFSFDFATVAGDSVKLEMWAFPKADKNVIHIHEEVKPKLEHPKKISDITSIDDYSAIFIPGGHGCLINLPKSVELGRLLHQAHEKELPIVTLCHGPGVLLSTGLEDVQSEFAYKGYKMMCFTDKTDAMSPSIGYLPGKMPWKCQEMLEKNGVEILNTKESGDVKVDREVISGDSPYASHNLGIIAAPILVEYANINKS